VLENIGTKKVFMKMDLSWGYNNVRIKEGDGWKVAFTTVRCGSHLRMKVRGVGSVMHRV